MKNKIAGIILGSALALNGCNNDSEYKQETKETISQTSKQSNNIVNCEKVYFNNLLYTYIENGEEKKVLNLKGFIAPIGVETACESEEIILNIKNFYNSGQSEKEFFSDLNNVSLKNYKNENSKYIVKKYKPNFRPKIIINGGKIFGSNSYDGNLKNDNSIFEKDEKNLKLNDKIAGERALDMFNDVRDYLSKYSEIEGLEKIELSSNVIHFSEEEIGELYKVGLKYNTKNVKNNGTLTNLINIFNKNPEKLNEEDYTKINNIIASKRNSLAEISLKQTGLNSTVETSNFNILILILYSLILTYGGYFYLKRRKRK